MRIWFLSLLLSSTVLFCQKFSVTDEAGIGLADVFIFNESNSFTTISDVKGSFVLDEPLADNEMLLFQHVSFETLYRTVEEIKSNPTVQLTANVEILTTAVVTTARVLQNKNEVTNQIDQLDVAKIQSIENNSTADVLGSSGKIFVQKSQFGGGSPIIRGFEANKVLLMIDGVRMNNAIYRGGHLQNSLTIDPMALEGVETIFGPGSLIFGSDAIGGVMHFQTKDPLKGISDELYQNISIRLKYDSGVEGFQQHVNVVLNKGKWGYFGAVTRNQYGTIKIGKNRWHGYDDWGQQQFYVSVDDSDDVVPQENENEIQGMGYDQWDVIQKVSKVTQHGSIGINAQFSKSSDIHRYDKLNDIYDGDPKFAEWYYGPQERNFVSFNWDQNKATKWKDEMSWIAAYQKISESRNARKLNATDYERNIEIVDVFSVNGDYVKQLNRQKQIQYGLELLHNQVKSEAFIEDKITLNRQPLITRYPDGENLFSQVAAYVRHRMVFENNLRFAFGIRVNGTAIEMNATQDYLGYIPGHKIEDSSIGIVGEFGAKKYFINGAVTMNISSGFRNPNIDDMGKTFSPQAGQVVIPNFIDQPEQAYNFEINNDWTFGDWTIESGVFYTYMVDLIRRQATSLEPIVFDGELSDVYVNGNSGKAQVYGLFGVVTFNKSWISSMATINVTHGKDIRADVPLGHIPPTFGRWEVSLKGSNSSVSLVNQFNLKKDIEDYSPFGEDKESEATAEGSPGWFTTGVFASYEMNPYVTIQSGISNIFDVHYIPFASGISGVGRSFQIGITSQF